MPLEPHSRLGGYEIVGLLGAGGMGEVYRARDPKLSRDVAIKILPDAFARDPERLARFDREARLLAALNHPHIAGIYGVEEDGDRKYLVLEFVDGESLAQRLSAGPLPVDEALAIARQLVDALEAAHERGVIHRDLKPANIVLAPDDQVKVLDFGLAKQVDVEPSSGASQSPTLSFGATRAGVILGTASYMSPEQVKGRPADKRSDVWAFGCVLYEMLTGTRAFDPSTGSRRSASGDDIDNISETLAAILRAEPDLTRLPASTPPTVRTILARCLEKDRKTRIPDISVVRFMLDNDLRASPATPKSAVASRSARIWQMSTAILAVIVLILAVASVWYIGRPAAPPAVSRFFVQPPEAGQFAAAPGRPAPYPRISPDGRRIVFTAGDASGKRQLWIRAIDSLTAQPLPETDGGSWPYWSADGRHIAYSANGKLMKVDANGGPPQTICTLSGPTILSRGGAWNGDGTIVLSRGPGGLFKVASTGGEPVPITKVDARAGTDVFPSFLPDGRHILFYRDASGDAEKAGIFVTTLDGDEPRRLVDAESGALYDAGARRLLFVRQRTLLAQSFDPDSLTLSGEPVPVAERIESGLVPGIVAFSLAGNGTLVYGVSAGEADGLQMTWVDRQGKAVGTIAPTANYRGLSLSPDGKRVAAHRHDGNGGDIWLTDTERGVTSRFTFDASQENSSPLWSPDGSRIAFSSRRGGKWGIYIKPANQTVDEEKIIDAPDAAILPMSWSPDGKAIVYEVLTGGLSSGDQWQVSLSGDHKAVPLLQTPFQESHGQISPDGRWLAYYTNENGPPELFVQSYPPGAGKWQISVRGGVYPRWSRDSHELFFMSAPTAAKMMAVDVRTNGNTLERGTPRELFTTAYVNLPHPGGATAFQTYDVTADGQRFLMALPPSNRDSEKRQIAVVLNWASALPK